MILIITKQTTGADMDVFFNEIIQKIRSESFQKLIENSDFDKDEEEILCFYNFFETYSVEDILRLAEIKDDAIHFLEKKLSFTDKFFCLDYKEVEREISKELLMMDEWGLYSRIILKREMDLSHKEFVTALIEKIPNQYYEDARASSLASVTKFFDELSPDDYREIHKIFLGKVWEMKSFYYKGRVISALAETLVRRREYDWAINFVKKLHNYMNEEDEDAAEALCYGFDEFDEKLLTEEYEISTERRLTIERCYEFIAEKMYDDNQKEDALVYFTKSITESLSKSGTDSIKIVLAKTIHFLAKKNDVFFIEKIENFFLNGVCEKEELRITIGAGIDSWKETRDNKYFSELLSWLKTNILKKHQKDF